MQSSAEPENLVKAIHNQVAFSENLAEQSTRSSGTSDVEIRTMQEDVLAKLDLHPNSRVLEIGCGTGVLAIPITQRVQQYIGFDFAEAALERLRQKMAKQGLASKCSLHCMDILKASDEELKPFTGMDRVLIYATIHYSRTDEDGIQFLRSAIKCLRPGGMALIGSIPIAELYDRIHAIGGPGVSPVRKSLRLAKWIFEEDALKDDRTRFWKFRAKAYTSTRSVMKKFSGSKEFASISLPPNYCLDISKARVEQWLSQVGFDISYTWKRPAVGTPMMFTRSDLLITRKS